LDYPITSCTNNNPETLFLSFFFFQSEDGIRDRNVTGVQTCALPIWLLADKAYSSRAARAHLRRRRIKASIAQPRDQREHRRRKGSAGGRPPAFDRVAYRGRNTVERAINLLKQNRAVATRYDKRAAIFDGTVQVASIRIWLRSL